MPGQYFGKYKGVVRDNRDDDNLGKLWVSVPAIFPEEEEVEARPALPAGFFFVPQPNTHVWVECEGGDPGLPLWTGIQAVEGSWPAEGKADPPTKRVIRTASGHVLVFDDTEGQESIAIVDKTGKNRITLDTTTDAITITSNKDIVFEAPQGTISLKAKTVAIEASGDATVRGATVQLNP